VLAVRNLAKRFGDVPALRDVGFAVARGEIVGFLGPNGAGKTTTLRILSTYLTPDTGTAEVAGHDAARDPMAVRRKLGYLPEHPPLYLDHTVVEFLRFCAALRGVPRKRRAGAVDAALARCGLTGVSGRLIGNLSKGFRQRVGLAQALVHGPEVLILDEPTVGLDPQQIREIRELIRSLGGEHTVLLSTHILPEVAAVCGRAIIVHRGRIVADAPLAELGAQGGLEEAFLRVTAVDADEPETAA
jgi:ABC-2 type transport system ATP-binding protein